MQKKPELLAPAGSMEKLDTAVYYGADSVYLAGKQFGLRAQADNFSESELLTASKKLHSANKKMFVTVNIFAKNADFLELKDYLALLESVQADGVIISDLGIIDFTRTHFPKLKIHISTQANTLNKYSAKFLADIGAKRIVLARELSLQEIREIRDYLDDSIELEAFVHGAMCISYSGRCLLSNYLTGRDANRGECVQACRWEYTIREKNTAPNGELEISEDSRGTYILNSKDLNMLEHIDKLYNAGVGSFKIEGRVKTAYYVATVVNAYRRAIDLLLNNPKSFNAPDELKNELFKSAHRQYTTGLYLGESGTQNLDSSQAVYEYDFIAYVLDYDEENKRALIEMRNRFKKGDVLEVLSPNQTFNKSLSVNLLEDINQNSVEDAYLVQQKLFLYTDLALRRGDILRKKREN